MVTGQTLVTIIYYGLLVIAIYKFFLFHHRPGALSQYPSIDMGQEMEPDTLIEEFENCTFQN